MSLRKADAGYGVAALLPVIGILLTIGDGVIKSADAPLHVHRIFAMTTLLQSGELWPRWVPWFHLGFGYPVFNFYPPGAFYLGGLLGLIGVHATTASTLLGAVAWSGGSVGMYALAKRFFPGYAALLAAALWAYAPSRLYEIWHQGSLPQMLSSACVPWVFWGLVIAAQRPTRRATLAVALPLAAMILTHQPVTLVTGLLLGPAALLVPLLYALSNQRQTGMSARLTLALLGDAARRYGVVFGGLLLGAGLSGIFLIPMALELRYVISNTAPADTIPYLISNFLQLQEVFSQPLPMDLTDLRFDLPTTFGLVGALLGAAGLLALLRRRRFTLALLLAAGIGFIAFMLIEASLPLWEAVPFLAQLRFPARILRVGAVFLALAGGAALLWLHPRSRMLPAALSAALTATLVAALPLVYPNQVFVNWDNLSALDEINMELAEYNWGTTSYDEFNPIWGEKPGLEEVNEPEAYITDPLRLIVNRLDMIRQWPDLQVEQVSSNTVRVTATSARPVRFRQFYFPGWTATLNGQPVEVYPEPELGQITLDVPAGEHLISLRYTGTSVQMLGTAVTLVSLAAAVVLLRRPSSTPDRAPLQPPLSRRAALLTTAAVLAFAGINTAVITPQTLWFRHRSPPDAPFYMRTPVHQSFGGVFELLGYTADQNEVAPGGLLNITLFWRAEHRLEREYRPVVQLVSLNNDTAWGASEPFFPGGGKTIGYPPDRFASDPHTIRVFEDAPPYIGRFSVQMLDAATGAALRLPDGSDRIVLAEPLVRISGSGASLPRALNYIFDRRIELTCAQIETDSDALSITLGWFVTQPPETDLMVFVHGLDASGQIIAQNDAPPLSGNYPAPLWQRGQSLRDRHHLPPDAAITTVAVGLYQPEGRLELTRNNQPVPDNRVILPMTESSCSP